MDVIATGLAHDALVVLGILVPLVFAHKNLQEKIKKLEDELGTRDLTIKHLTKGVERLTRRVGQLMTLLKLLNVEVPDEPEEIM